VKILFWLWLFAALPNQEAAPGRTIENAWKSYRSAKFGYELSFPSGLEFKAYFEGSSGDLRDEKTGKIIASLEVWPPDECPRQSGEPNAKDIGIQRAQDVTQADGHGSSSHCSDPIRVQELPSAKGLKVYELELTCISEIYPDAGDDETDSAEEPGDTEAPPIVTNEGKKGPTYFADISQPWRKRVLILDPVGNNPMMYGGKSKIDAAIIRAILARLRTFPVPKPPGICIEDLPKGGFAVPRQK